MQERPRTISEDLAGFWGGYAVEFKLVDAAFFGEHKGDLDAPRRNDVTIGQGRSS